MDSGIAAREATGEAEAPSDPLVLREDADGVAWLTLNNPHGRNVLSIAMLAALDRAVLALSTDASVRVVVLAASGPAFCAGHDLRELLEPRAFDATVALFRRCGELMVRLQALPKPVIACVHGMATAAGCQLVAACDLAVAGESARFATPGVNIGLFCSTPMVAVSRAMSPKAAMEMLLTGEPIGAARALETGLINRVVPDAELVAATQALAVQIAGKSPVVLGIGKEAFRRQAEMPLAEAYRFTAEVMAHNLQIRDAREGIAAFLEKREPTWTRP